MGIRVKTAFNQRLLLRKVQQANFRSLTHGGAAIRLTARRSIRQSPNASNPGTPPHTRRKLLKNSLIYNVEKRNERALIGPAYSKVGTSGHAHEFGGRYRGQDYPRRSFMGPALKINAPRLPRIWAGSIK